MAEQLLKDKIRDLLKSGYFRDPDDFVLVSDGPDADSIHVVVVSKKFKGVRLKEKHDLIWSELIRKLTRKEWGRVTLSVGVTPEEIKALA
jgi:acid stress-induced BolA-like protein IbaG/YrbA